MPKWKPDAKEFTVAVNFQEVRGYQAVIPRPVAQHLGNPEHITYKLGKGKVEVRAAKDPH